MFGRSVSCDQRSLEDWIGPRIYLPVKQNPKLNFSWESKIPVPSTNKQKRDNLTVLNAPILSSMKPPAIAPIPQKIFTAI